jgi:hypothetical protein
LTNLSFLHWLDLLWLPGFIALQSIPHTGALRTLFLLVGILHLVSLARRAGRPTWPRITNAAWWLALLTIWLILQSAWIAQAPHEALAALASEWGKVLLMVAFGVSLTAWMGHSAQEAGRVRVAMGLFLGHFVHVIATLAYQAHAFWRHGTLVPGESLLGNYGYVSPFVTGALAFLLAEKVIRLTGRCWLPFSNTAIVAGFVATLAALAVLSAKASIVVAVILFLIAGAATATLRHLRRWLLLFPLTAVMAVAASLLVSNRWHGGLAELEAAVRTPTTEFRILGTPQDAATPLAHASDGSFYLRAVWAKIALEGIIRHPLGLGYGADAFGRYVATQGGPKGMVSSHSGWIDFALANGIPGLALLLGLLWSVSSRGWQAFRAGSPVGLFAVFVVANFMVRSLLDGHLAGSRLTGFAFVAATLWALVASADEEFHADRSA